VTFLFIALCAFLCLTVPAFADQIYTVNGKDSFTAAAHNLRGDVVYTGTERLTSTRQGDATRFAVSVQYARTDQGAKAQAHASFVSIVTPSGEQHDEVNGDPDYVAVLNQPFSIQLDLPTLRDIARLDGPVPFTFVLPLTGAPLSGTLRRSGDAYVGGNRVLGVIFDAEGPVHGPLGRVGLALDGRIHMHGTAYYGYDDALLRALDTRLSISGKVVGSKDSGPVTIVYRRTIRASAPGVTKRAAR
jgi:hypothetical protein